LKEVAMRKPDKCIHFNGFMNAACDAGVKYDDVIDRSSVPFSLPCITSRNSTGAKCDKCQMPTAEEVAADEAQAKRMIEDMGRARKAIVAHLGGPWKRGMAGGSGCIDCPVCKKPQALRFSRAGRNGHVHADCATEGCVSWME
jgi:hypothetical protein